MNNAHCSLCGKELEIYDILNDYSVKRERIGYGSMYDGMALNLCICSDCLDKMILLCKINPLTKAAEPVHQQGNLYH